MRRKEDLLRFLGFNSSGDLGPWTFYTAKNQALVWYIKAPPLEPPSVLQESQRNAFRLAAYTWRTLSTEEQQKWETVSSRTHLSINGYNLFVFWILRQEDAAINTLERQSGINLIPLQTSLP